MVDAADLEEKSGLFFEFAADSASIRFKRAARDSEEGDSESAELDSVESGSDLEGGGDMEEDGSEDDDADSADDSSDGGWHEGAPGMRPTGVTHAGCAAPHSSCSSGARSCWCQSTRRHA